MKRHSSVRPGCTWLTVGDAGLSDLARRLRLPPATDTRSRGNALAAGGSASIRMKPFG